MNTQAAQSTIDQPAPVRFAALDLPPTYHVYMPGQRGHGNSTQPETGYRVADFPADAIAFIEALNMRRVTLIGHSMGSFIAQQVAAAIPNRVARLVLAGSATKVCTKDVGELAALFGSLEDPVRRGHAGVS